MHLTACGEPQELLRPAPVSALCAPRDGAEWAGYWALDGERYFARLRVLEPDDRPYEQWFTLVDTSRADAPTSSGDEPSEGALRRDARAGSTAFTTRVVFRRVAVTASIDGPAIHRVTAAVVGRRRGRGGER